jgi:hypothetical protein
MLGGVLLVQQAAIGNCLTFDPFPFDESGLGPGLHQPRDRELTAAVREIGEDVRGIHGDVSNLSDLDRLFAQIKREKGRLDIECRG